MEACKIWIEKCEAARMIEDEFGTDKALIYLKGLIVSAVQNAHGTNQASSWMAFMHSSTERASKMPTHSFPV